MVVGRGRKWWSMVVDVVNIVVTQWMVSCDVHPSQKLSYSDWYSDTWMIWIITVLWHDAVVVVMVARHDWMSFFEMMMTTMTVVVWN